MWIHSLVHRKPEETFQKNWFNFLINNQRSIDATAWHGFSWVSLYTYNSFKMCYTIFRERTGHICTKVHAWSSEDNLWNSIIVSYHVGLRNQTDIANLGTRHLYLLSYFPGSHKPKWTQWYFYRFFFSYHTVHFLSHLSFPCISCLEVCF